MRFADRKLQFCIHWEPTRAIFLCQRYGPAGLPLSHRCSDNYRLPVDPVGIHPLWSCYRWVSKWSREKVHVSGGTVRLPHTTRRRSKLDEIAAFAAEPYYRIP